MRCMRTAYGCLEDYVGMPRVSNPDSTWQLRKLTYLEAAITMNASNAISGPRSSYQANSERKMTLIKEQPINRKPIGPARLVHF